jgi:predicted dehydrogenase
MTDAPSYAILGRGRWAQRMRAILEGEGRRVVTVPGTRRKTSESDAEYKSRLATSLAASSPQIAWLCVSPGPHIPLMLEAAVAAGLHGVAEKPWQCARATSKSLTAQARAKNCLIAIHTQYCLLAEVEAWRRNFSDEPELGFGGRFTLNHAGRLGIAALDDLGSHLLAIRAYAVPQSTISEVRCGYEMPDERRVWLEKRAEKIASIDFLDRTEPVIQRYIHKLEAGIAGAEFPFDLAFASRVADDLEALKSGRDGKPA